MQVLEHGWQTLFRMYFNREISLPFIDCANNQITQILEKELSGCSRYTRIRWGSENELVYNKGVVSCLRGEFAFIYGYIVVDIKWHSRSKRIYDIADTDIDCADIIFELNGLDVHKMSHYIKPRWSLFTFPETTIEHLLSHNKLKMSPGFLKCADEQLSRQFEYRTGLKINKQVSVIIPTDAPQFLYEKGIVSKFSITLFVSHNWNPLFMLWKSKSGRIYDIADEDINCDDIEFSFNESFDALLYHKQMYPKVDLPFKFKNLPFELVIERLNMDCVFIMELKPERIPFAQEYVEKIDQCIDDYSMKAERSGGNPVHNWRTTVEGNTIVCDMDSGYAEAEILKVLVKLFTKLNVFSKVTVQ